MNRRLTNQHREQPGRLFRARREWGRPRIETNLERHFADRPGRVDTGHLDRTSVTSIMREINLKGRVTDENLTSTRAWRGRLRQANGTLRQRR